MSKLTVRVTRPDGSVSFKGSYGDRTAAAKREQDAWIESGWTAEVVDRADPAVAAEVREWERVAVRSPGRFFPEQVR